MEDKRSWTSRAQGGGRGQRRRWDGWVDLEESEGKKVSSTSTYLAGLGWVSRRSKAEDKIGKIEM